MSRLLVISHTPHYKLKDGAIVGFGPTIRELDYLAKAFGKLEHLAPLYNEIAPRSALPYKNPHVLFTPLTPSGGKKFKDKFGIILNYPFYFFSIRKAVARADMVQLRLPCNIGIVALFYFLLNKSTPRWAKYAGNWIEEHKPLSYRFQKWWLTRGLYNGPVTINGKWPRQPNQVVSFYNPCLSLSEVQEAKKTASNKQLKFPIRFIYVGNIKEAKGVGRALDILADLKNTGILCRCDIVGDGEDRKIFEKKALELQIQDITHFHSSMPRYEVIEFYLNSHFLIFPSITEGFPKVISEAMAYGVVPIAGAVSSIPQVLKRTGAGVALPPYDKESFIKSIRNFIENPEKWRSASEAGIKASSLFTYEFYLKELDKMFRKTWGFSPIKKSPYYLSDIEGIKKNPATSKHEKQKK